MGWTAAYLLMESGTRAAGNLIDNVSGLVDLGIEAEGWNYFRIERSPIPHRRYFPLEGFETEVAKASRALRQAFFALSIEDDDYVYMFGGREQIQWRILISEDLARETSDGAWALRSLHNLYPTAEWKASAAADFAQWSKSLPRPFDTGTALSWLQTRWVLPGEFINLLFDRIGLPRPSQNCPDSH